MALTVDQPFTRPSLLIRLRDPNDQLAWEHFVELYGPILYHYCCRRGLQESDAAEVMQEVLIQVSRSIRSFHYDRSRGRFRGWLTTIMKQKLAGYWKRRSHDLASAGGQLEEVAGADDGDWNHACQHRVLTLALSELRNRLSDEHWTVFEAVWIQQRSPAAVAAVHARDAAWVYLVKSRGLSLLRDIVQQIADDVPWFAVRGTESCDVP